ncbi:MAG TPA: DUF6597 domain-containing transcriptional factor, partial [Methylomicrobium sp.]|nr:DUF6597 domain-containing transcriptional factor [Methylomicrobium sp.]
MNVILPGKILAPYVEAYYISSDLGQASLSIHFPAISTSYIKFSPTSAVVSGQATKPMTAAASFSNVTGLGVKLRAGAFRALFGIPAHELTDRVVQLEEVLGNTANELHDQITEAPTPVDRIQRFERNFVRFVQRHADSRDVMEQQTVILLQELSTSQVSKLAERLGYSPRQFQRKLNELIGFSPRLYKRIFRFEK